MPPPVMGELIEPLEGDVSYQGYDELQYNEDKAEEETYCEETLADE